MIVPDFEPVAEVMLFIEGFKDAKMLARRVVELYKLCGEQLSQSKHYDFGMRSIKSLLLMAALKKQANVEHLEEEILLSSILDCNAPKLIQADENLFLDLVSDIGFSLGSKMLSTSEDECKLIHLMKSSGFEPFPEFCDKVMHFYKTAEIRLGILGLGPPDSGKTTIISLASQLKIDGCVSSMHLFNINPKSLSVHELYGNFQPSTKEWQDGLSATIFREINTRDSKCEHIKWVVFDGPIDALWIENMNTVLDDNQCLCLANGERLQLSKSCMRIVFEVDQVSNASPATISRVGVVFVPERMLSPSLVSKKFLALNIPNYCVHLLENFILDLFSQILPKALEFVKLECKEDLQSTTTNLCLSCCHMFVILLEILSVRLTSETGETMAESSQVMLQNKIKDFFLYSVVWSVGSNLNSLGQDKFDVWARTELQEVAKFGRSDDRIFDFFFDSESCRIANLRESIPPYVQDKSENYNELFVPTIDTARYSYLIHLLMSQGRGMFVNGQAGIGKSVIINQALMAKTRVPFQLKISTINFCSQMSSARAQKALENSLNKSSKGKIFPPFGYKLVYFVDDVNLPSSDSSGAHPPVEFLRQLIDNTAAPFAESSSGYGGLYDRKCWKFYKVIDVTLLACCCPHRSTISQRFSKHLHLVNIILSSNLVLRTIFGKLLQDHLQSFCPEVQSLCKTTVEVSIHVHEQIVEELIPSPHKFHYIFNLRDLSRIYQSILCVKAEDCTSSQTFIKLWIHETQRVYEDRLTEKSDVSSLRQILHQQLRSRFKVRWSFESIFDSPILFGDFVKVDALQKERHYTLLEDRQQVLVTMKMFLDGYNMDNPRTLDLVLFDEALQHVSRISRILRFPQGHALLVGPNGCGKQSSSRLSAFIMGYHLYSIESYKGSGIAQFCDDLKKVFWKTGIEKKPAVIFLDDSNIVDESILDLVNSLLLSVDLSDIYSAIERERIIAEVNRTNIKILQEQALDPIAFFLQNIKNNLHLILSMSPFSNSLRERCRKVPSILNNCTLNWYVPWSENALQTVAEGIFRTSSKLVRDETYLREILSEQDTLTKICVKAHGHALDTSEQFSQQFQSCRYLPPKFFVDYLKLFLNTLQKTIEKIHFKKNKLVKGVLKMSETTSAVESLRKEIEELKPILDLETQKNQSLFSKLTKEKKDAEAARQIVETETKQVEEQATKVSLIREDAQSDLNQALPILEAAIRALNSLTRTDIVECKSFLKPPALVQVP